MNKKGGEIRDESLPTFGRSCFVPPYSPPLGNVPQIEAHFNSKEKEKCGVRQTSPHPALVGQLVKKGKTEEPSLCLPGGSVGQEG